ncbi:hypothetical protein [Hydrogenophaga sp. BPS33]|nr:hypothetical protein [Hydrogenophaga sp. BPS33]
MWTAAYPLIKTAHGGLAFVMALACFAMMVCIARAHDPLGFLRFA